jgi:hypothetical protein
VDVIVGAIDQSRHSAYFANDAAHVGEQVGPDLRVDEAGAVLGAEYRVKPTGLSSCAAFLTPASRAGVCLVHLPTAHAVGKRSFRNRSPRSGRKNPFSDYGAG